MNNNLRQEFNTVSPSLTNLSTNIPPQQATAPVIPNTMQSFSQPQQNLTLESRVTSLRRSAELIAIKCGIRADLKGFERLVDAILLYGENSGTSFNSLYLLMSKSCGVKPKTIMREISYALSQAFNLHDRLSQLLGIDILPQDLHSGLVIAYLSRLVKFQ